MRLLLVASSGGHLAHLLWLAPWWRSAERAWVTFDTADAREALEGETVHWAWHPTNRSLLNLVRNAADAPAVVRRAAPDLLVTSGAGVGVPYVHAARRVGVPSIYLEVTDRVHAPSWTGWWLSRWVDEVALLRPEQRAAFSRGVVIGGPR